jgi:hypothetical protein
MSKLIFTRLTLAFMLFLTLGAFKAQGQATIKTDLLDYPPGPTAIITGTGFQAGETVTLQVLHDPTGGDDATDPSHQPWTVVADGSGNVSSTWTVPSDADELGATLKLTAIGGSSGLHAEWVFTDADPIIIAASFCTGSTTTQLRATTGTTNASNVKCLRLDFPAGFVVTSITTGTLPSGWALSGGSGTASINISGSTPLNNSTAYVFSVTFSNAPSANYIIKSSSSTNNCPSNTNGGNSITATSIAVPNIPNAVPYNNTYDGLPHTGSATVGTGETVDWYAAATGATTASAPTGTNVGTYTAYAEARNTTTGCVSASRTLVTVTITKANPTIVVTPYSVTYDATAHTATGSAKGVLSENLAGLVLTGTTHINAGTYAADTWTFTDVTGNYNNTSGTVNDAIAKADPAGTVTPYSVTYDGNAHTATYTFAGVNGETGVTVGTINVAGTTHTNAGTYNNDPWSFAGAVNYNNTSGTVNDAIAKADPTVTVTPYSVTYDGNAHTATYTITGVNGESGATMGTIDISGTTHTGAGTYNNDPWTFAGAANYNNTSGVVNDAIAKASSTTVVTINGSPFTYTGVAQTPATVSVTGAGALSLTPPASYLNNTNAGTATASYTYAGDANHTGSSDSKTFTIDKATTTTTVTIVGGPFTYTGAAQTPATVSVTGANLSLIPTSDYANNINAGTATASYTYAGDANHTGSSDSKTFVIGKATTTTTVTIVGGPFTYTGSAITPATVSVTGANLSLTPTSDYANNTNAGTATASYTYAGDANHLVSSDSKNFTIAKANATIVVTPYSVTYDATAHTATGTAKGVLSENLAGLVLTGTTHTNAGTYAADAWTFTDVTGNYNNDNGTVSDAIAKKTASVTPNAAYKYCGQMNPPFTGTLAGFVDADNVTAVYSLSGSTISATLSPASVLSNYNIVYNTAILTINSVSIDASATSTAIPLGTPTKQLSALVTSGLVNVSGAGVTFTVTSNVNNIVSNVPGTPVTVITTTSGVASYTLTTGSLPVGLYAVTAEVGSGCASTVAYFSVYDPNAGFVTGGGWINSPAGAYTNDVTLVGKANFGFNAQYKKGNTTPDGNTQFQFQAGNLNFKSSSYSAGSLVIAGAKAIFQGTGTINGSGTYNFMISAIDGTVSGGGGVDKFRIKIWSNADGSGVVYDNNQGYANNADPATALGGGSIVIHSTSKTARAMTAVAPAATESLATKFTAKVLPNPSHNQFTFLFSSPSSELIKMNVLDYSGRLIEQNRTVSPKQSLQIGQQYRPGVYYAEFTQGSEKILIKLIKEAN